MDRTTDRQTVAQRAKFTLEFGFYLHMAGRDDAARQSFQETIDLLDQLIAEGN